jgi:lysophospholipase L1-like esterase
MFLSALALLVAAEPAPTFALKDGDRVVWLGSTLVEREQRYGHWEAALLAAHADKKITFRNLGWSGDTVHGEARGRFDFNNADKCFKQIVDQTLELKPTVIFVSYGTNESFEGKDGLPKFEKGLAKLLDALKPTNARVMLFTPTPAEKNASLPDPKPRNAALALYADAIKAFGAKRGLPVADLFGAFKERYGDEKHTDNGLHFTDAGYKLLAQRFVAQIAPGASLSNSDQLEALRKAVVTKNEQFFNKWRPQNETYLTGFRKHEQGRNAKEIAEFDPFIAKAEDEIAKLLKELK